MLLFLALLASFNSPQETQRGVLEAGLAEILEPGFVRFTPEQGLPASYVFALQRDQHDRLWVGTSAGLFVIAGGQVRSFPLPKLPGLSSIGAIKFTKDGAMWLGSQAGGVVRCVAEQCTVFDEQAGLPSNWVWALEEHGEEVYVATAVGLCSFDGKRWQAYPALPKTNVRALLSSRDTLWIGTDEGLFRTSGGQTELLDRGFSDKRIWGLGYAPFKGGVKLWIGTETDVGYLGDDDGFTQLSQGVQQASHFAAHGQTTWISSNGALTKAENGKFTSFTGLTGQAPGLIYTMQVDVEEGRPPMIWVGCDAGLLRAPLGQWETLWSAPEPLRGRFSSLTRSAAPHSDWWFADEKGVVRVTPKDWQRFDLAADRPGPVWVVTPGPKPDSVMLGTQAGDLEMFSAGRWQRLLSADLKAFDTIFDIEWTGAVGFVAKRTGPWIGQQDGFVRAEGAPDGRCFTVAPDLEVNTAWFGCEGAIGWVKDKVFHPFEPGKAFNKSINFVSMTRHLDKLWVGTGGAGALRIDLKSRTVDAVINEASEPPLPNGFVNMVLVDAAGFVYVSTDRGLVQYSPDLSQQFLMARDNGLVSDMGIMNAGVEVDGSQLWFATSQGVAVARAGTEFAGKLAAKLHLEQVKINGAVSATMTGLTLQHDLNNLSFHFFLGASIRERDVRYRSQLVGLEPSPSEWSQESKRVFTTLPSGTYQLNVWARDEAGRTIGPVHSDFVIKPAPWLTWWAYSLYAASLVALSWQFSRYRLRQVQARALMLEQQVEKRTEEIQQKNVVLEQQKTELEESYRQADLIFGALKQAMAGKILDDRFQLGEVLGEGGFGVVYRATEIRTGRIVAAKIFRPQAGNDSTDSLERFKREAILGKLATHPHAVEVIDAGVSQDNVAYIIMELLTGVSLASLISTQVKIPVHRACDIILQTLDALDAAHQVGLIHRDIKPDNIFLKETADGGDFVKVLDFGIAKALHDDTTAKRSMTMTGSVVGTPVYVAPERLKDQSYDGRSDVYACGVVFYEMLVGHLPFESQNSNMFSIVVAVLSNEPEKLAVYDPSIPRELQALVDLALSKEPEQRPTARAWAEAIRSTLKQLEV